MLLLKFYRDNMESFFWEMKVIASDASLVICLVLLKGVRNSESVYIYFCFVVYEDNYDFKSWVEPEN